MIRIVTALAGLLLCVAYADSDFSEPEERILRTTLGRIQGLSPQGVDAIIRVLRENTVAITTATAPTYARELLELTDQDFRIQALDTLLDLAAADDSIDVAETNILRAVLPALGLTQQDFNTSQARHRDKLSVLKSR